MAVFARILVQYRGSISPEAILDELRASQTKRSSASKRACLALVALLCVVASASSFAQDTAPVVHANQEVRVALPASTATGASAVLATELEAVLQNDAVCCGKNSALEDAALSHPTSLKELSDKVQGSHVLSDGRTIMVNADYVLQSSITPDLMIGALKGQRALLVEWKSHIYVLYGAIFDETIYSSGQRQYAIRKLLLLDPRFSDKRREAVFKRETDDWEDVQGLLTLSVAPAIVEAPSN
jgi:hypothetical protein